MPSNNKGRLDAALVEELLLDGRYFLSFDGRVLELFGQGPGRYHVRELRPLQLSEPKRDGRRTLEIGSDWGSGVATYPVAPAEVEATAALISHVNAALTRE